MSKKNKIAAFSYVSESEIILAWPEYTSTSESDDPEKFLTILNAFGLDTSKPYERQDNLWHRNRLNQIVLCSRFVGHERLDTDWIDSGYASQEAKDKVTGSKLLEDLYRAKNLTEDTQDRLESRHRYSVIDESVQV